MEKIPTPEEVNLMYSGLVFFTHKVVTDIRKNEWDDVRFTTLDLQDGFIQESFDGFYDVYLDGEIVYRIEPEIFNIMERTHEKYDISTLYKKIKKLQETDLKLESKYFIDIIKYSLESIILHKNIPLKHPVKIEHDYVVYTKQGDKIIINLN